MIKTNISFGLIMDTFPTPFLYAVLLHLINHSSIGQNVRPSDWVIGSSAIHQGGTCQRKDEFGYIWFGVFWWLFFYDSIKPCVYHQSHPQLGIVFASVFCLEEME